MTAKKYTKKRDARAKSLFCLVKLFVLVILILTQGLFRPFLKTFVAPFNPARLTAPGSPRMRLIYKDIKTISLDKQDHDLLVSSEVLMYGNFRSQVHITVRGVHICPFSCPTLSSLYSPLSVLPVVKSKRRSRISAAPLTWRIK